MLGGLFRLGEIFYEYFELVAFFHVQLGVGLDQARQAAAHQHTEGQVVGHKRRGGYQERLTELFTLSSLGTLLPCIMLYTVFGGHPCPCRQLNAGEVVLLAYALQVLGDDFRQCHVLGPVRHS